MEWTNPGNNRVRHQTSPQATLLQRDAQLQSGGLHREACWSTHQPDDPIAAPVDSD